jgi:tetratricopeptide (TPR) repeat protein
MKHEIGYSIVLILALATSLCRSEGVNQGAAPGGELAASERTKATAGEPYTIDPCSLVLAPHSGDKLVDREIGRLQGEVHSAAEPSRALERLGWMFIAKARASFDSGFYKLAEQCALCLDTRQPESCEALLLRGHALHNLNRFREAEPLARELVAKRGLAFDLGLLGDILMERGRLNEAAEAYQKMIDLKPDLHSYARGAHLRWLKGNLSRALELI